MFANGNEFDGKLYFMESLKNAIDSVSRLNAYSSESEWLGSLTALDNYDGYICNELHSQENKFPSRRWTFLHHAAFYYAPISVLEEIKAKKFVMSLKDAEGHMAIDHVKSTASPSYKNLFKPRFKIENIDLKKLNKIEKTFHGVINSRVEDLVNEHNLILPTISVLLEKAVKTEEFWFAVPGMFGGFTIELKYNDEMTDVEAVNTTSWCRAAAGSCETYLCTENNVTLEDTGECRIMYFFYE
ncbi:uncharacterized protein LOC130655086 [Hydractinia symbiolongicarpus]|uniref:uncharacterized protein LOC130655086 n=1 Tax=Hydractinia symbiolongicarpus TaxID=13093 RepID=UPI00254C63FB|nr:uncharacterized protein LOC130655086 [Hydractinia symbiolongicarpus]